MKQSAGTSRGFSVADHSECPRLQVIQLEKAVLEEFFNSCRQIDERALFLNPYQRFLLAGRLRSQLGKEFQETLVEILHDRRKGGIWAGVNGCVTRREDFLKFATAFTHLIGIPHRDPAGDSYFACLAIEGPRNDQSVQTTADVALPLHTDGAYEQFETDWLCVMKTEARNAGGGESRLLHLDDWEDLDTFLSHPLAFHEFIFQREVDVKLPPVKRSFLYRVGGDLRICANSQEVHPETIEESYFIRDFQDSLQQSVNSRCLALPPGNFLLLNNYYWLHGREAFQPHPELRREIIRQRGVFRKV